MSARGRNSAVVDGVLRHWSPSQVVKYRSCARRWHFDKVQGLPEPMTGNMALGHEVHSELEANTKTGAAVEHPLALLGLTVVPDRTTHILLAEQSLTDPPLLAAGVPVSGFIDLLDITDADEIGIYDYKTRSDLRYALTPDQLARDPQMVTYAAWAHAKFGSSAYKIAHVYLRTRGKPAVKSVSVVVTPSDIADTFSGIEDTVRAMSKTAACTDVSGVEPNWSACFAYNKPCPYMSQCVAARGVYKPPPDVESIAYEELSVMSVKEKIAAHRTRATGINPPDAAKPDMPTTNQTPAPMSADSTATAAPVAGTPTATIANMELVIFVDCLPIRGIPTETALRLEDEIAARSKPIADKAGVTDVREIRYGEGTTQLVASFKRNPPRGVVLATSTGLSGTVLDALLPLASLVVRGLR